MHHAGEEASHTRQDAVSDGQVEPEVMVEHLRHEEAKEGTHEERRCEDAADTARRVRDGRGHHLQEYDACHR